VESQRIERTFCAVFARPTRSLSSTLLATTISCKSGLPRALPEILSNSENAKNDPATQASPMGKGRNWLLSSSVSTGSTRFFAVWTYRYIEQRQCSQERVASATRKLLGSRVAGVTPISHPTHQFCGVAPSETHHSKYCRRGSAIVSERCGTKNHMTTVSKAKAMARHRSARRSHTPPQIALPKTCVPGIGRHPQCRRRVVTRNSGRSSKRSAMLPTPYPTTPPAERNNATRQGIAVPRTSLQQLLA